MKVWKTVLITLVVGLLLVGGAAAGMVYTGVYNVAANARHWPITHWVLTQTVHHSVEQRAADIETPDLGGDQQLLAGAANFDAMCSSCHAPPGAKPSVAARGMYPQPPDLAHAGREMTANEIYWVIKNGIKASGMPAWGASHGDDEMWAMTAFIQQLPDMSKHDYAQLLARAEASDIGHHHDESSHDEGHDDAHGDDHHPGGSDPGDGHGEAGDEDHHADGAVDDPSHSHSHDEAHTHG